MVSSDQFLYKLRYLGIKTFDKQCIIASAPFTLISSGVSQQLLRLKKVLKRQQKIFTGPSEPGGQGIDRPHPPEFGIYVKPYSIFFGGGGGDYALPTDFQTCLRP